MFVLPLALLFDPSAVGPMPDPTQTPAPPSRAALAGRAGSSWGASSEITAWLVEIKTSGDMI